MVLQSQSVVGTQETETESKLDAFNVVLLSLFLSLISIFFFIQILNTVGLGLDFDILLEFALFSQISQENFTNLLIFTISIILVRYVIHKFRYTLQIGDKISSVFDLFLVIFWFGIFLLSINLENFAFIIFYTTPLILTGLSVAIAFRGGLFNIGGQGQMIIGGVFAGIWAAAIVPQTPFLSFLNTPILLISSTLFVSIVFGGIWGLIPGLLRAYTGAHEVITTILMNFIALNLASYLVGSPTAPFVQKSAKDAYNQTERISPSARILPINEDFSSYLNWSVFIIIIVIFLSYILLFRTNIGFRIRATGYNKKAAEVSGINTKQTMYLTMMIAGAIAGLAGGIFVMTEPISQRYVYGQEGTFGWDGIAVALLGANNPFPIILASLLFGFLKVAGLNLNFKTNQFPPEVIITLQAFVILFAAAPLISYKIYNNAIKNSISFDFKQKYKDLKDWVFYTRNTSLSIILVLLIPYSFFLLLRQLNINIWEYLEFLNILNSLKLFIPFIFALLSILLIVGLMVKFIYTYARNERVKDNNIYKTLLKYLTILIIMIHLLILFLYVLVIISIQIVDPVTYYLDVLDLIFVSKFNIIIKNMIVFAFPIVMAAIGGAYNERSGNINIGLEGILLFSAFGSVYVTFVSGNPYLGIIGGLIAGFMLAFVHALFTISFKADHIVTGVGVNLLAFGLTDLLTGSISGWQTGSSVVVERLPILNLSIFVPLFNIPILGNILSILSTQSLLLFVGILLIPIFHIILFKTAFGLRIRVVGEEPGAAATAGLSVVKYRYFAVLISGLITSIGGIYLAIGDGSSFNYKMTGGRGFVALAALIFGKWTIAGSTLAGLFFGYFYALSISLKKLDYFAFVFEILTALPFIIAILVVAGAIGLARPPKAIGKIYDPQD